MLILKFKLRWLVLAASLLTLSTTIAAAAGEPIVSNAAAPVANQAPLQPGQNTPVSAASNIPTSTPVGTPASTPSATATSATVNTPGTTATSTQQPTVSSSPPLKTWGYLAWWLPDAWRTVPLAELDRLVFFELKANASGKIHERQGWPEQWQPLRTALAKSGTKLELALTLLDSPSFMALFQNPEAINTLQAEALALAKQDGVHGLHLDFEIYEAIPPQQLQAARGFVVQLAQALKQLKPARTLSVFYPLGTETALYDAPTLAVAQHVVLQGYDAHWLAAPTAGPVAPLRGPEAATWEKTLTQLLALGVPRQRILFSFPLYGYEWPLKPLKPTEPGYGKPGGATSGKGVTVTFAPVASEVLPDVQTNAIHRVQQYGASHEPLSSSSYYQYTRADGQAFEGWFEDWWSVGRKTEFLQMERLYGMAFFPLGYDQGELLDYFLRRRSKPLLQVAPLQPAAAAVTLSAPVTTAGSAPQTGGPVQNAGSTTSIATPPATPVPTVPPQATPVPGSAPGQIPPCCKN